MKKRQAVKAVIFLVILIVVFFALTSIFSPKWIDGTSASFFADEFYGQKKDTVEVGIIGSSQIVFGISAGRLLDEYGISAFSCGTGEQPILGSLFYLKELDKRHKIKVVLMDTSMLYETEDEPRFRNVLDTAPMSMNKLNLIMERSKSEDASDIFSYFFPLLNYHDRWTSLRGVDFKYKDLNTDMFWGNIYGWKVKKNVAYEDVCVEKKPAAEPEDMNEGQLAAFEEITEYCKENEIELVLFKTPKLSWTPEKAEGCRELAERYGLPYLDFNTDELLQAIGFDVKNDIYDSEHLNVRGADKVTDYLGEYLRSHYELEDFRKNPDYDPEKMARFRLARKNAFLQSTIQVEEYLTLLDDPNYEIIIQKSGDLLPAWSEVLQQKVNALGATADFNALDGMYYVAQLSNGSAVREIVQSEPTGEVSIVLNDSENATLHSGGEDENVMKVAGESVTFAKSGYNIVVYDSEHHTIADIATLYINQSGTMSISHKKVQTKEEKNRRKSIW